MNNLKKKDKKQEDLIDRIEISAYPFNSTNYKQLKDNVPLDHPLIKPFKILFRNGKPIGYLIYLFLRYNNENYLIGTLTFTKGGRILFFPGIHNLKIIDSNVNYIIEHFTCEYNLKNFHIKIQNDNLKIPSIPLTEFYKDFYHWFTIAFHTVENLVKISRIPHLVPMPKNDTIRRIGEIKNAFKLNTFLIFEFNTRKTKKSEFWNLELYITKNDSIEKESLRIFSPLAKPAKKIPPNDFRTGEIKCNDIDIKIFVVISILKKKNNKILPHNLGHIFYYPS